MKFALGHPLVTLDDVDVRLWGRTLLAGVTFDLREGESWAVFGGNGAGKSTLLRLLRGDLWPHPASRGRRLFHLDGATSESPIGARERIALVSAEAQDLYLRRDLDVRVEDVVRSGFTDAIWPGDLLPAHAERAVDRVMGSLGVGELRRRSLLEISTGEARRVLLARALAPGPRALLLDEFVNGLDAASREIVLRAVSELARGGTATLLATHRPEEVIPEARRAAILEGGRIVRIGPRDEVEAAWRGERPGAPSPLPANLLRTAPDPVFALRGDVLVEGRLVLRDLKWRMRPGEGWVVRGPNGAGKSTFLRLLLGEEHLAPGGTISRLDLGPSPDVRDIRARVGLVAPDLQARHRADAAGLEVVLSGFAGSIGLGEEMSGEQRDAARACLSAVGALHLADRSIQSISYGEMRRLLFARALVTDPDVLLLDEPFSGLEPRSRAAAMDLVDRLVREGRSVVLVTHHDDEVVSSLTHELLLRGGRVERAGPRATPPPPPTPAGGTGGPWCGSG
ncbi:MAG: ATP-binding cassette domain-containing protein [Deltaproteobacteria bacterium]